MRCLKTLIAIAGLGLALSQPAAASECKTAYLGEELARDLGTMSTSLRSLDEASFKTAGARLQANLACIKTPIPAPVFASAYRMIGTYHYFAADEPEARRWFLTSLELDPTYEWDVADLSEGHPLRALFDELRSQASADPVAIEGMVLNIPAGSEIHLDGVTLTKPQATLGRPHILQLVGEGDHTVRQVFVIEGNEIPKQFLRDANLTAQAAIDEQAAAAEKKKRKKKGEPEKVLGEFEVIRIERVRPASKTPLMVGGGLIALGSGALYAMTFATHDKFDSAQTTADLEHYQSLTNTLVVASGATLAVGLGVGYAGIMLDGGPGLAFGWQF